MTEVINGPCFVYDRDFRHERVKMRSKHNIQSEFDKQLLSYQQVYGKKQDRNNMSLVYLVDQLLLTFFDRILL